LDARLEIEAFEHYFGLKIEEKNFESVGGLINHLLGRVPVNGEKVTFQDLEITILEADNRRIKRLLVERRGELENGSD
jgi:CBS domain containing-hemolysin-like protein